MAISISNGTTSQQFINLAGFRGSGEVTNRYLPEVTGVLLGIEPRGGFYEVKDKEGRPIIDPKTGKPMQRPQSWTAHFADGSMWSWPTYVDETTHQVLPWSRFDPSIDLGECVAHQRVIHVWKDDRNFSHLELVETTVQMNPNPLPIMGQHMAPAAAVVPETFPWEIAQ